MKKLMISSLTFGGLLWLGANLSARKKHSNFVTENFYRFEEKVIILVTIELSIQLISVFGLKNKKINKNITGPKICVTYDVNIISTYKHIKKSVTSIIAVPTVAIR